MYIRLLLMFSVWPFTKVSSLLCIKLVDVASILNETPLFSGNPHDLNQLLIFFAECLSPCAPTPPARSWTTPSSSTTRTATTRKSTTRRSPSRTWRTTNAGTGPRTGTTWAPSSRTVSPTRPTTRRCRSNWSKSRPVFPTLSKNRLDTLLG